MGPVVPVGILRAMMPPNHNNRDHTNRAATLARARTSPWPSLTMLLSLAIASFVFGCGDDKGEESTVSTSSSFVVPDLPAIVRGKGGMEAIKKAWPQASWWKEKHAVTLMLVGGQRGKLKPCGCSAPQLGGVTRLATIVERMRQRASASGGAIAGLALGGSLADHDEPQRRTKASYVRAIYSLLNFAGVLLDDADVREPAMTQPFDDRGELGRPRPPVNVRLLANNFAFEQSPYLDLHLGPLAMRAVHVLEPADAEALTRGGAAEGHVSVTMAFQHSQPTPETLWLVALDRRFDGTLDELTAAVGRLGPAIVVDVSGGAGVERVDGHALKPGQEPLVVSVDELGKTVGVLDLDKNAKGVWEASYRRVPLHPSIDNWSSALGSEAKSLLALYNQDVKNQGYLRDFPTSPDTSATFVGSARCASCHASIHAAWAKTKHAHALDTLTSIQYDYDPECIRCHVVGWERADRGGWIRRASGFQDPERSAFLGGVGCENCHGPGSLHIDDPWNPAHFGEAGPNTRAPSQSDCMRCHDIENSHGFADAYDQFRAHIDHRVVDPATRTVVPAGVEAELRAAGKHKGAYGSGR